MLRVLSKESKILKYFFGVLRSSFIVHHSSSLFITNNMVDMRRTASKINNSKTLQSKIAMDFERPQNVNSDFVYHALCAPFTQELKQLPLRIKIDVTS